jgi:hypothetical protein
MAGVQLQLWLRVLITTNNNTLAIHATSSLAE